MAPRIRVRHFVPCLVTGASITLGFMSIVAAARGRFDAATLLIFTAGMCDLCDGRIARWLGAVTPFGGEIDSLSDAVSFCVAPALLVYFAALEPLGTFGVAVAVVYLLAGLFRLARFNLDKHKRSTFFGVPTPAGAGYLLSFVVLRGQISSEWTAVGVALIAVAMVSTLKVPNFKDRERTLPMLLLPLPIVLFLVFFSRPTPWTWHLWNAVNLTLVAMNYRMLARRPDLHALPVEEAA